MYDGNGHNGNGHGQVPDGKVISAPIQVDHVPEGLTSLDTTLVYAPFLNANLRDKVERFRRVGVSLLDELALTRAICASAVESFSNAMTLCESGKLDVPQRNAVVAAAGAYLQQALNNVRDMVISAHRIMAKESMDPQQVQMIIFQCVKAIDNEVQREAPRLIAGGFNPQNFMDRLSTSIDESIQAGVVDHRSLGTDLIAENLDDEVREMLDSVPEVA